MKLSFAEVFETATFYAHFDVVKEGEPDIPPLTIRVCDSLSCAMLGAEKLLQELQTSAGPGIRVVRAPCVGLLRRGPGGGGRPSLRTSRRPRPKCWRRPRAAKPIRMIPPYIDYDAYVKDGGYKLLNDLRAGRVGKEDILKALDDSSLRGLGGAGFPTGRKWRAVLGEPGPRLMAVNGDEGEPGTFKDRFYLLRDPHRFLEGMLIGAHVVDATDVYIYLRDEYPGGAQDPSAGTRQAAEGRSDPCTSAARRRRLYLRRGILAAGEHRGQARPAAAQAAIPVPGRAVRPARP